VFEIRNKQQEVLLSGDAVVFRQQLSDVLSCMREELDDHRLAINENTGEIGTSNEFLGGLARKLDKLTERVDELTLLIKGSKEEKKFDFQPLTEKEKEVFQALYALTETQPFASYDQLARKTLQSKSMVAGHVTSMVHKGVPLLKKYQGKVVFLKLSSEFREAQAKKNIVGISARLTCWIPR
jgi:DNA-binding MarR family transcriptional regulator